MVVVNNEVHMIGGYRTTKHLIWNLKDRNSNKCVEMYDFKTDLLDEMFGARVVYIKSKNMILLIGGINHSNRKSVGIWRFCLKSKKWFKSNIAFEFSMYHSQSQRMIIV